MEELRIRPVRDALYTFQVAGLGDAIHHLSPSQYCPPRRVERGNIHEHGLLISRSLLTSAKEWLYPLFGR